MSANHLWCLLVLASALTAGAEEPAPVLSRGARVRVTAPSVSEHRLIGKLLRHDQLSIGIVHENGSLSNVSLKDMMKLEVSGGRRRKTLAGALCGAALGFGLAALGSCTGDDCGTFRNAALVVFTPAGAGVGALVGSAVKTERWHTLPIEPSQSAAVRRGAKFAFTLRF